MTTAKRYYKQLLLFSFLTLGIIEIKAQSLEPRLLSPMPIKGNVAVVSYIHSRGNILVDNSLPVKDLAASLNNLAIAYLRSFKLFNRLTKIDVVLPYSAGKYDALVNNEKASVTRNGLADPQIRLSIILLGIKPLGLKDFFKVAPKKFKLGINVRVRIPLGAYNSDYLLNIGTNRFTFQTGLGTSYTFKKKIIIETHLNSWLFTENTNFLNGNITQQQPLFGLQIHTAYVFKPGVWLAISAGKTSGGKLKINDVLQNVPQNNSRVGAAFSFKINKHSGLKLAYTSGFSTRAGADFNSLILAYNYLWFNKARNN